MGTVLDKDKAKKTVTLLTKSGVVTVRIMVQFSHIMINNLVKNYQLGKSG